MGPTFPRFLLVPILLAAGACAPGADVASSDGPRPPVILVSVDTLRADRLPVYGAEGVETPAIDGLAGDAILYEHAFTHAPTTLASHASIFTGVLPGDHGARNNASYVLRESTVTLAETLRGAGYRTGGFVSAFPMRAETGIGAGFERYDARFDVQAGAGIGGIQREGDATLREALAWLERDDERPPFLFLHLFEPHLPYTPPADLEARYGATYAAEIAASDRLLGRLVRALRERDLYDEALVVFLSDHGEGLGDHGEDEHGLFVYTSTLHVPLLVKLPGNRRAGERVQAPAQLVDVLPTVLEMTGLDVPASLPGSSLLGLGPDTPTRPIYSESYVSRLNFGWSELLSLIEYPLHYIAAPDPELYELSRDPQELDNLVFERPALARSMEDRLAAMEVPLEEPQTIDREARDRLMALGYVGTGGGDVDTLADPKTKLHLVRHLETAARLFFEERLEEAAAEYESVLQEDPGIVAAWEFLGRAQLGLERFDEALVSFETLVSMNADDAMINRSLAELYLRTERPEQAAEAARRATAQAPADPAPHRLLADALLAQGSDLELALEHADRAIELAGERVIPGGRVVRGRILVALGRQTEAAAAFRDEIRDFPANLQAYRQLAQLHLRSGAQEEAGTVLEEMVERNPGPVAMYWAIGILQEAGLDAAAEAWRARAAERYPEEPAFQRR